MLAISSSIHIIIANLNKILASISINAIFVVSYGALLHDETKSQLYIPILTLIYIGLMNIPIFLSVVIYCNINISIHKYSIIHWWSIYLIFTSCLYAVCLYILNINSNTHESGMFIAGYMMNIMISLNFISIIQDL
jgi:hypothetical protein